VASRKQTPDILSDLLDGKGPALSDHSPDAPDARAQLAGPSTPSGGTKRPARTRSAQAPGVSAARRAPSTPRDAAAATAESARTRETDDEPKAKATFYLGRRALDVLDEAHYALRRSLPPRERSRINKSLIVEAALHMVLDDLEDPSRSDQLLARLLA
jgi:hypothetical protein